ncbi:MAG: translesion DNA synthesis-associated protein ImuA [Steroidobacteraceae bacterium]
MSALDDLLRHPGLWRAREQPGAAPGPATLPTGYAALDRALPGGGWPRQGLVEILADRCGVGELSLLVPALAALCDGGGAGWLALVAPPYQPYAPALAARGIPLAHVLVVRAASAEWAMEQALRSGACGAVVGWSASRDRAVLRRLQLAAETSSSLAVLFRASASAADPSPAVLRLVLEPGARGLDVRVLKSRGGRPVTVHLGWLDAATPAVAH